MRPTPATKKAVYKKPKNISAGLSAGNILRNIAIFSAWVVSFANTRSRTLSGNS